MQGIVTSIDTRKQNFFIHIPADSKSDISIPIIVPDIPIAKTRLENKMVRIRMYLKDSPTSIECTIAPITLGVIKISVWKKLIRI